MELRIVQGKGKAIFASKNISQCETIFNEEQPLVSIVHSDHHQTTCHYCFHHANEPLRFRCQICKFTYYCSKECAKLDFKPHLHKFECQSLTRLHHQDQFSSNSIRLMGRLVRKLIHFKNQQEWSDWESLVTHNDSQQRKTDISTHWLLMTSFLFQFFNIADDFSSMLHIASSLEDWQSFFLKELCRIKSNSFAIHTPDYVTIGTGIFVNAALLNHSCLPNAVALFEKNNQLIIKALRNIKQGEEICISYLDLAQCRRTRKRKLKTIYCFECCCERCSDEQWSQWEDDHLGKLYPLKKKNWKQWDYSSLRVYYQQVASFYSQTNNHSSEYLAKIASHLLHLAIQTGKFKDAIDYAYKVLQPFKALKEQQSTHFSFDKLFQVYPLYGIHLLTLSKLLALSNDFQTQQQSELQKEMALQILTKLQSLEYFT